jgi:hypothetical protein
MRQELPREAGWDGRRSHVNRRSEVAVKSEDHPGENTYCRKATMVEAYLRLTRCLDVGASTVHMHVLCFMPLSLDNQHVVIPPSTENYYSRYVGSYLAFHLLMDEGGNGLQIAPISPHHAPLCATYEILRDPSTSILRILW